MFSFSNLGLSVMVVSPPSLVLAAPYENICFLILGTRTRGRFTTYGFPLLSVTSQLMLPAVEPYIVRPPAVLMPRAVMIGRRSVIWSLIPEASFLSK